MSKASLVTGGSGFIASNLITQLLENGHKVHTTVRSLKNKDKISYLLALQEKWLGELKLFEADLLVAGSFDRAMVGCSTVYHVASPFLLDEQIKKGGKNSQKDIVDPALKGTQHVLEAVEKTESVKVVIMTSTVGAIFGDYADTLSMKNQTLSEEYFNTTSSPYHNAYHHSKSVAESEAWRIHNAQSEARWKLVTIAPGLVMGPSLSPASDSGSLFLLDELLRGELWFGTPNLWFTTVDIREVVDAHIKAAETPSSKGRYILCEKHMTSFKRFSLILREFCNSPWWMPRHNLPNLLVRVVGPFFGLSQKWMTLNLGIQFKVNNQRSIDELGIQYRPLEETLADHYQSWAARNYR